MSIASLEQVKGMLRSMFGVADRGIASAQAAADKAQEEAVKAQNVAADASQNVASKMEADNPVGTGSFSMGRKAGSAVGANSHAAGFNVEASGNQSHAEGNFTTASGLCSHAEGSSTTASGSYSHAEGSGTTASGDYSHAEGGRTKANFRGAHAEGYETIANGFYSHAEGQGTVANVQAQHVQGKFNIADKASEAKYAHIVGNGTSDTARSNAHTLDWDGNAWYAGTVEGTALILTSPNGTRYQITVDDTGALTATEI